MNIETIENLKAAFILLFFGSLIVYGGHYVIGGVAIVGSVLVALAPIYTDPKFIDKLFGFGGSGGREPLPWYLSPLPYIALVGFAYACYVIAT